jgi:two-component system phosphate regulon response regulator PhoB
MNDRKRHAVLVASGDESSVALIHSNLLAAGFDVHHTSAGEEVVEKTIELNPALVILDMMLPVLTGKDVLRLLKSSNTTSTVAVVVISHMTEEIDRIVALELGADDFVAKPFSARELALRVKAILSRRSQQMSRNTVVTQGRIALDADSHSVSVDGRSVDISALDFRLLSVLMGEGGRVISREKLIEAAWGEESGVLPRTVDTQLRRLRCKLGPAAKQIQTIRGFGYRLGD